MAVALSPVWSGIQFLSNAGQPLSGGKIWQYQAGTTTLLATFTDNTGTVQNANPIILDSTGRYAQEIWFTKGQTYKLLLQDSGGSTITFQDMLTGINDLSAPSLSEWNGQSLPTFISSTSFSVGGNQVSVFPVNGRIRCTLNSGFVYGTTISATFGSVTTIVFSPDVSTPAIDNTISAVATSFLGMTDPSMPTVLTFGQNTKTVAIAAAATTTIDCNLSNVFRVSMGTNVTSLVLNNPRDGQTLNIRWKQDATGSRTITWPASFKWAGGSAVALSTAASALDFTALEYDGTDNSWIIAMQKGVA